MEVTVVDLREHATAIAHNMVTGFPGPELRSALDALTAADGITRCPRSSRPPTAACSSRSSTWPTGTPARIDRAAREPAGVMTGRPAETADMPGDAMPVIPFEEQLAAPRLE